MGIESALFGAVPLDDQGARLLANILGPGWDSLAGEGTAAGAAGLVHGLLSAFNWVALAGVCLLFVVVIIQGVASTACEGVPLGRRYSSLWMPLRFAGAMGLLAPVVKGLSVFQVLILMAVGSSVNLANYVWEKGLDRFVENGGRLSLTAPKVLTDDSAELGRGLLKGLTIQQYYRQRLDLGVVGPVAPEIYWPPATSEAGGLLVLTLAIPQGSQLSAGDLGRLRLPCPDPSVDLCRARLSAVRTLITALSPIAEILANTDRELTLTDSGRLARAVEAYRLSVSPWLETIESQQADQLEESLGEFKQAAKTNGWVTAGAYYWTIARLNEAAGDLMYSTATWSEGDPDLDGEVLDDFDAVFERLNRYLQGAFKPERATSAENMPSEFPSADWFGDSLSGKLGRQTLREVIENLESGDPIMVLASLGRYLVATSEMVIGLKIASNAAVKGTGQSSSSLLGNIMSTFTGSLSSFAAGAAVGTVEAIGPYILILSLLLISYGFFLAYFLPAMPFLIYLAGVITWVITVVEALAAAPLWVAAHALPEGDGLAGNGGRQGYLLMLGVLLRPPLMVFGFLTAMALMTGTGRVVGYIFAVFGFDRLGESFLGLSGFMAFSIILGLAVVAAAWKLFGLISHLPERVMAWIGTHAQHFSEVEDVRRNQGEYAQAGGLSSRMLNPATSTPTPRGRLGQGQGQP
ncbi:MAG: DotA/TraY family protein [Deltaproteobacteria bacterium]|jgi:hypothetical protein|nr:DotA/TraY family protein [Deltaproteobacteria bacterium]